MLYKYGFCSGGSSTYDTGGRMLRVDILLVECILLVILFPASFFFKKKELPGLRNLGGKKKKKKINGAIGQRAFGC